MTARSSTGNFSKFGTYYLYKLRTMRPMIILMSIFSLLSYPLLTGFLVPYMHAVVKTDLLREEIRAQNPYDWDYYSNAEYVKLSETEDILSGLSVMAVVICVIMLIAIFFMSFIVTRRNFRWLYNKTVVDMDYSLPISDDTRFFGDLAATLSALVVPHLAAIGIGELVFAFRPRMFEDIDEVISTGIIEQALFSGLFACIMLAVFVLFVISVCGRKAETALYPLVLTVLIPIIHAVCLWLAYGDVYGYTFASSFSDFYSLSYTSPIGFLIVSFFYCVDFGGEIEEFALPLFRAQYGIPVILVTVALLVAAYFLIKYRRAERVGQPFVYRLVKFIIPAVITFAVVSPFIGVINEYRKEADEYSYTPHYEGFVIAMMIVTFVLYVIMELISGKGFRRFHITLLKYVSTMAVCVLVCVGLLNAHGFGIANYVPDADDVQSVYFSLRNYNMTNSYFSCTIDEEENIAAIIEAHEALPKERQTDDSSREITLQYYMKNGDYICREYYLTRSQYNEWLEAVMTPEAFFEDNLGYRISYLYGDNKIVTEVEYYAYDVSYKVDFTLDDFVKAYRRDCDNATFEQLFGSDMGVAHEIELTYRYDSYSYNIYNVPIYGWMSETISLLKENNAYIGTNNIDISLNAYPTSFLIEMPTTNYCYFDAVPAFIMAGDTSVTSSMLKDYGYSDNYVAYNELNEQEYAEYKLYGNVDIKVGDIMDFNAVRLDKSTAAQLLNQIAGSSLPMSYDQDTAYALVLVTAENAYDYLTGNSHQWLMYYISEEYYDEAAALFAKLN